MVKKQNGKVVPRTENIIFKDLERLCQSPGYIHAIAYFCFRDNLISCRQNTLKEEDIAYRYTLTPNRLIKTEIATLIGLMAKNSILATLPEENILSSYIKNTEGLLEELHNSLLKSAFSESANYVNPKKEKLPSKEEFKKLFSSGRMLRESIFYAGDSAYDFQYLEFAKLRYRNDNAWLKKHCGFYIEEACATGEAIRNTPFRNIELLKEKRNRAESDSAIPLDIFSFTPEEISALTSINLKTVQDIINKFCICSYNKNISFQHLNDFNTANAAPIISLNNGKYALLYEYMLAESLYESPFFWMWNDQAYRPTLSKNRGAFVEEFIKKCFLRIFPEKYIYQNIDIYKGKDRFCEGDILILYGDYALVIQAKSKKLTLEARKGNDGQLKEDFKKAVKDAYNQAISCSQSLLEDGYRFTQNGQNLEFPTKPKKIYPICVVSDHYPALAMQAHQFLEPYPYKNIEYPLITDLFFIDMLTEMLTSPFHIFDYINLRTGHPKTFADQELVILSRYIKDDFILRKNEQHQLLLLASDIASTLDIAMLARRAGAPGAKTPKGILTRLNGTYLSQWLEQINANERPELVDLGIIFLHLTLQEIKNIDKAVAAFLNKAQSDGKPHDFSIPFNYSLAGLTIYISYPATAETRDRLIRHCTLRKYKMRASEWFGLVIDSYSGAIMMSVTQKEKWKYDQNLEKAAHNLLKEKSAVPITTIPRLLRNPKTKIGRNAPCPCDSGKKYKKCCLNKNLNW